MSGLNKSSGGNRPIQRNKSIGFVDQNGAAAYTFFREGAGPVEIADAICREAGGTAYPLQIEGIPFQSFDFSNVHERIHDITWSPAKGNISYYRQKLEEAVGAKVQPAQSKPKPSPQLSSPSEPKLQDPPSQRLLPVQEHREQYASAEETLRAVFTESRAAAIEAEFGQLIVSCLDEMETTVDTLIARKVELIKERIRIEMTIKVLEERIDQFKQQAGEIVEQVDPYEEDLDKLGVQS